MGLSTSLEGRRIGSRPASRSPHRPQFEKLEDRIVPSIADGTILVTTGPSSFSSLDQSSFPIGIIGIDPHTGAQIPISTGGAFSLPTYVCEAPNQQLYVTDLTAFGTGAIFRVDPNTGQQFLLTKGGYINGPNSIAFVNGSLYVANTGDGSGKVHSLVQVDPNTSQQRLITSDGGFVVPTGMTAGPGDSVYVADEPGGWSGSDPGGVWQVNLSTGAQTQITHGGYIVHASDVSVDPNGNLLTMGATSPTDYVGSIVRTNPVTGVQTQVSHDGILYYLDGMTLDASSGMIYTGAISTGAIAAAMYAVDPVTGAQTTIATGGLMSLVEGIRIFHTSINTSKTATNTVVAASATSSVLGQTVTFTATVGVPPPGAGMPTGTMQFQVDGANFGNPVNLSTTGSVATASLSTASLTVGTHTVAASYSGDNVFSASDGVLTNGQVVNKAGTTTVVVSSVNPSTAGQMISLSANVAVSSSGGTLTANPTGVVTFLDGPTSIGQGTLSPAGGKLTASLSVSSLTAGNHTLTATYAGDSNFVGSTATLTQTIQAVAIPLRQSNIQTITVLVTSAPMVSFGQPVTLSASVLPNLPASAPHPGSVMFLDRGVALGIVPVSQGVATFTATNLSLGGHYLTALYTGSGTTLPSWSGPALVTVGTPDERFIGQLYVNLLQRQPEAAGLVSWVADLKQGMSRSIVALAIEQSPEGRTAQVQGLYEQFLHRTADPAGLKTLVTFLGSGGSVEQAAMAITSSAEYLQTRGGGTTGGFVTALYQDAFQRSPDAAGLVQYTQALDQGASRLQVAGAVFGSTEYLRKLVAISYEQFLKRAADNNGLNSFVTAMQAGVPRAAITAQMLSSDEFVARV